MSEIEITQADMDDEIASWRWRVSKLGLNQKKFAQLIDRHQPAVSLWFKGEAKPNLQNFFLVRDTIRGLEYQHEADQLKKNKEKRQRIKIRDNVASVL